MLTALRDVIRCAYFASAASCDTDAGASSASAAPNGNNATTRNPRSLASQNDGDMSNKLDTTEGISSATLCLLDDPLTSLDAHTREHVLRHCIHGLMRGNPRVAVVVTCGEINAGEGEGESRPWTWTSSPTVANSWQSRGPPMIFDWS